MPGHALSGEELWKPRGQNDRLLQGTLGALQTGNIVPLDVGFASHDGALQTFLQLLFFFVFCILSSA